MSTRNQASRKRTQPDTPEPAKSHCIPFSTILPSLGSSASNSTASSRSAMTGSPTQPPSLLSTLLNNVPNVVQSAQQILECINQVREIYDSVRFCKEQLRVLLIHLEAIESAVEDLCRHPDVLKVYASQIESLQSTVLECVSEFKRYQEMGTLGQIMAAIIGCKNRINDLRKELEEKVRFTQFSVVVQTFQDQRQMKDIVDQQKTDMFQFLNILLQWTKNRPLVRQAKRLRLEEEDHEYNLVLQELASNPQWQEVIAKNEMLEILSFNITRESIIGKGLTSQVWKGSWTTNDLCTSVAVKTFRGDDGPDFANEVASEVYSQQGLDHPNIVKVHGYCTLKDPMMLVMELGTCNLASVRATLSYENRLQVAHQLALALQYLNGKGILHRQLKGSNVILFMPSGNDPNGPITAKLADFGHARVRNTSKTTHLDVVESMITNWTAPEIINDTYPKYGRKQEIYSFGMLLSELTTGKEPFAGHTKHQMAAAILSGDPPGQPLQLIPRTMWQLVQSCTQSNPWARPTIEEVVQVTYQMCQANGLLDGGQEVGMASG